MLAVHGNRGDVLREQLELEHKTTSIQSMRTAMLCSAIGAICGAITAVVAILALVKRR